MTSATPPAPGASSSVVITPEALREHWQGHRALTRRVIDAFPDDQLFTFAVGGMRPFGEQAMELLRMAVPIVRGVASGIWKDAEVGAPTTKAELLARWDEATTQFDRLWATIPAHRFQEVDTAFGQWTMPGYAMVLYGVDNEIHHRGQGYVYLRALGIEPPPFWERGV